MPRGLMNRSSIQNASLPRPFLLLALALAALAALSCARSAPKTPGDVSFTVQSFARQSVDCDSVAGHCAKIRIQYPEITSASSPAARDSIQAHVLGFVLRTVGDGARAPSVEAVMQGYLDGYEDFRREAPASAQPWEADRQVAVLPSIPGIISLEEREFLALGGAHPNSTIQLASFDARSGGRLALADLLAAGHDSVLSAAGEKAFRAARELHADSSLNDAGFWFEQGRFRLNANFAVTADGLRFYFNAYEVAPHVLGPTDLVIPFADIAALIRPDGPLASRGAAAAMPR